MVNMTGLPRKSLTVPDTANALLQNRINISIIFNYLRDHGPAYRAEIARGLGISAPAVSRAIKKLRKDGYVIESERMPIDNGKRAARISINAGRGCVVGVDLLADPIEMAISDFAGTILHTQSGAPAPRPLDYSAYLVRSIQECIRAFQGASPGNDARILAIGLGVPAVVEPQTGSILRASLYETLARTDFKAEIGDRFKAPVFVENISNLAAIGEWKRGLKRNVRNMLFIQVSNGIGAGIIMDGDLYRGSQGSAGEIGYFITEPAGLGCDSSRVGYLESRASLAALREAALAGAEPAAGIVNGMVRHLAVAIVNAMILLNPEIVVIGGAACELPGADSLFVEPLIDAVKKSYPFPPAMIQRASLGARASIFGALQLALDSLIVNTYPYRL